MTYGTDPPIHLPPSPSVVVSPVEASHDPRAVDSSLGTVIVEDLVPNTHYTISLMLTFKGGGVGPSVQQHSTTLEDGEWGG